MYIYIAIHRLGQLLNQDFATFQEIMNVKVVANFRNDPLTQSSLCKAWPQLAYCTRGHTTYQARVYHMCSKHVRLQLVIQQQPYLSTLLAFFTSLNIFVETPSSL